MGVGIWESCCGRGTLALSYEMVHCTGGVDEIWRRMGNRISSFTSFFVRSRGVKDRESREHLLEFNLGYDGSFSILDIE